MVAPDPPVGFIVFLLLVIGAVIGAVIGIGGYRLVVWIAEHVSIIIR